MSTGNRDEVAFSSSFRIYYEDTDAGGIVYHANYLKFMERCRCDWLDSLGHDVVSMEREHGLMWVVHEANIKFMTPARLFDEITVSCHALQVGKVKLLLEQNVYNGQNLLCSAVIKLATLDSQSFKLSAMPQTIRLALS